MNSFLKKIGQILLEDIPAKLFILGLSVFLWYFVNVLAVEAVSFNLPVRVENAPEGSAVVPLDRMTVQVQLRSRMDIAAQTNQIKAYVDLSRAGSGEGFFPIRLEGVPEGVFSSVLPYSLRMDLDTYVSQELPLVLNAVGADDKNHVLDYRWMPSTVTVRGPSRAFRRLKEIESEPLDIRKVNKPQITVPLKLKTPPYCFLSRSNALVYMSLAIERFTNVVEIPLTLSNLPETLRTDSLPLIRAEIISRTSNQQLLKERLSAFADAADLREGRHTVPVTVYSTDEILSNRTPVAEVRIFTNAP